MDELLPEAAPTGSGPTLDTESRGPHFWRSLEERLETPEFRDRIRQEFPDDVDVLLDPVSRRKFLTLLGASVGLAGLAGCNTRPPSETIVPYVKQPEELVPGKPLYYATSMPMAGWSVPILVESHEGRPTKVEGNPDHPSNLMPADKNGKPERYGPTDIYAQASVLSLYDPDRSQNVTYRGQIRPWADAQASLEQLRVKTHQNQGEGLWVLTEAVSSPTLVRMLERLQKEFPKARLVGFEPARVDPNLEGLAKALGKRSRLLHDFKTADVVVSLDGDFLGSGPEQLISSRDFMGRRQVSDGVFAKMNRLYAVESMPTSTGLVADHRLPLKPSQIEAFARLLARKVGLANVPEPDASWVATLSKKALKWVDVVAKDLLANQGRSVVVAGAHEPATVHALVFALNSALENVGKTVRVVSAASDVPCGLDGYTELLQAIVAGKVQTLFVLGGNPAYASPAVPSSKGDSTEVRFADVMDKVGLRIHLGPYLDETASRCHWHIPEAHYLESWSDSRSWDGVPSIIQPLIAPLYAGKTAAEVLSAFIDSNPQGSHDLVRATWKTLLPVGNFEPLWRKALHDGFAVTKPEPASDAKLGADWAKSVAWADGKASLIEINVRLDPTLFDGRFANNGWLQELPKVVTKLTWDNAAMVSPATAKKLNIAAREGPNAGAHGDMITELVEIKYRGATVKAPLWAVPGHPDDCVTVHLGYGRERAGKVGNGTGFDAYKLWHSDKPFFDSGVEIKKTGESFTLACTQGHQPMDSSKHATDRGIIRAGTWDSKDKKARFGEERESTPYDEEHDTGALPEDPANKARRGLTMLDDPALKKMEVAHGGQRWGMSIDVGSCTGCGACVAACYSENNIPVVGKTEVTRGREMAWLRIDRYFAGTDENDPEGAYMQPVPCMHCENAPCEVVCPVQATTHSPDGLNEMTYNRCVGTRYCANNCPYKVRRFNFLHYADYATPSLKLGRNPDVTVRSRGVMEKCTFCVQRIRGAEIEARNRAGADGSWAIDDGEVVTACQAVCPTRAIVFGDLNDPKSRVTQRKAEPLNYGVLLDLNTRPRTTYLAAVRNPNPELVEHEEGKGHG